jgi:hypothetical protein
VRILVLLYQRTESKKACWFHYGCPSHTIRFHVQVSAFVGFNVPYPEAMTCKGQGAREGTFLYCGRQRP